MRCPDREGQGDVRGHVRELREVAMSLALQIGGRGRAVLFHVLEHQIHK